VSPVLTLAEAARHPHNAARANVVNDGRVWQPAPAPRIAEAAAGLPAGQAAPADRPGSDSN
jgi:alpha-methylacyl-CoA racemase